MRLQCIKMMSAHWGSILTEGNWYEVTKMYYDREVEIITNYDKWVYSYWYDS